MGNSITGKEYPLLKIFSSDFEYHIPPYQRPYAWGKEQAGMLFDDLYDFFQSEQNDNYFLGSIVLIKDETNPHADVIDGQQRLTTLSILFSVLANNFTRSDLRKGCQEYLQEAGNELADISPKPRLTLRKRDQEFFHTYIQNTNVKKLLQIDPATLQTEAQKHIQANADIFQKKFDEKFPKSEERDDNLKKFSSFLLNRCFLIAVSTSSQESAFRIFSVMNSRGLDLLPTDIIKSETIGKLPPEKQESYTLKWEDLENMTGRDGFNEVFAHTRTIFAKERPRKNLLEEFREFVVSNRSPEELIDHYLEPYTIAYKQLKNRSYSSTTNAEKINDLLYWLNKTNNNDWMPAAIKFLSEHQNDSEYVLWFIHKLERLASYLFVTAQDVNQRVARYKWVLVEMEDRPDSTLASPLTSIELTEWEKARFLKALNGEIYTMPALRRNYIIQRLDSFISDGGATYNPTIFTVEHILPQHPSVNSEWTKLWPDENIRKYWLNRIANLVPLTRQRNSAAQNYDFQQKKEKYFQSKKETSTYTLTTRVINIPSWTPEIVKKRQEVILEKFAEKWDLQKKASVDEHMKDFMLAGRGASANGHPENGDEFTVVKGSKMAADTTDGFPKSNLDLRQKLKAEGIVNAQNIFVQDYTFSSPSAAASVVLGRSANGLKEWTTLDGRSISQIGH